MGVKYNIKIFGNEILSKVEKILNFETEPKWSMVLFFGFMHIFGAYWCYNYAFPVKWQTVAFAIYMYFLSGSGITCGVHRLWTHKSYKASLPLRIFLMINFASVGQNTIYDWVRDHRQHHKYSDTPADPHNANRGFWFSHIGWLLMRKNKEVIAKGKLIDMSDIESDPVAMFDRKYHGRLMILFCFVLPTLVGIYLWKESWQCAVAWQCFIRYLGVFHAEMTVNSFAHMFGYRPYNKNIKPVQSIFVSTVTAGEGWHNYHHAFPSDFRAAETMDIMSWSTLAIRIFAWMGLAWDLKEASPELIDAVRNAG